MHNYKIKTAKLTKLATVLSSAKGEAIKVYINRSGKSISFSSVSRCTFFL